MPRQLNRLEIAGSLGDLGTLLPLAIGMIVINGLNSSGLLLTIGLFYILAGWYYQLPMPVQPMKVIGAYAVATGMSALEIQASGLLMGMFLLIIGLTGMIDRIRKYIPLPVVRGVQLATGALLMAQGVRFIAGASGYQTLQGMAEPFLRAQTLAGMPIGLIIGMAGAMLTLLLIENKRLPAGLMIVGLGLVIGLVVGTHAGFENVSIGLYAPAWFPFGFPAKADFAFVLFALVLPQIPMTLGNAVIANADLAQTYFGANARRVTPRALCLSMGLANVFSCCVGGMPLCHGAGGLAAHYRFGARTAVSNMFIGVVFMALALFFGPHAVAILHLIPLAVLGILLFFAGSQLAMAMADINKRADLFVVLTMLGITLAANLAIAFFIGIGLSYALKWPRLTV